MLPLQFGFLALSSLLRVGNSLKPNLERLALRTCTSRVEYRDDGSITVHLKTSDIRFMIGNSFTLEL